MTSINAMIYRNTRWPILIPLVLAFLYIAPNYLVKPLFINVRNIHVYDAETIFDAKIEVHRTTRFSSFMRYSVSFRRAVDNLQVCIITSNGFPYRGGLSEPIIGKNITWWARGSGLDRLKDCADEDGLHDGEFYLITCHTLLVWEALGIARRCVRSNDFTLGKGAA